MAGYEQMEEQIASSLELLAGAQMAATLQRCRPYLVKHISIYKAVSKSIHLCFLFHCMSNSHPGSICGNQPLLAPHEQLKSFSQNPAKIHPSKDWVTFLLMNLTRHNCPLQYLPRFLPLSWGSIAVRKSPNINILHCFSARSENYHHCCLLL